MPVRVAFLVLCSTLLAGCSALFVTPPPARSARDAEVAPECTTSAAAPVIDAVLASVQAVRTGYALAASDSTYRDFPISRGADAAIGATLTIVFAASAAYGFATTSSCEQAKREFRAAARSRSRRDSERWTEPIPAAPRAPEPPPVPECTFDAQCDDTRVCEQGQCVEFQPSRPSP